MESSDGLVTVCDKQTKNPGEWMFLARFEKKSFLADLRALVKLFLHLLYLDQGLLLSCCPQPSARTFFCINLMISFVIYAAFFWREIVLMV